jgi:hypothetical protein
MSVNADFRPYIHAACSHGIIFTYTSVAGTWTATAKTVGIRHNANKSLKSQRAAKRRVTDHRALKANQQV